MHYVRASLVTSLPLLAAPVGLNWLFGYVDPSLFSSLATHWKLGLGFGAYLAIATTIYTVTRLLGLAGILSKRSLVLMSWLFGLLLALLLMHTPGALLLSVGLELGFSLLVVMLATPLVWLWWFFARIRHASA